MKNTEQHPTRVESSVKSLLLLSVNFRLVGAVAIVLSLWLVLGQLL
ncbi:hypothetical protein [Psychromonas sp.]